MVELRDLGVMVQTEGGARLPVASGGRRWAVGDPGLLCLRPEALTIEEAERARGGIRGTVAGHVFEGGRQTYDVAVRGAVVRVEMVTSAALGRSFRPGDGVKIEVSPETAILLPPDADCVIKSDMVWAAAGAAEEAPVAQEMTPQELKARLDARQPVVLLDVRDGWETALCRLEHAVHIPTEEIEMRAGELDPAEETVVYCHHCIRSAAVAEYLRQQGFGRVFNLAGGIDQWARAVDRSMRRY